jgi:hypothetical protein
LLSPLLIGLFAGGRFKTATLYLVVAALCGFLCRQPITLAVKALSGRRSREDLRPAVFWMLVYAAIGALHVTGLVLRGFGYVLYLVVPALPVFAWYLYLVSRREERRQMLLEIVAAGAMALSAPAGLWIGVGEYDSRGWLLWALVWAQSAASIVYAYLRLEQRVGGEVPGRFHRARASMILALLNVIAAIALGWFDIVSRWLFVPYAVQWIEVVRGALRPAVGLRPQAIGMRQALVSGLFTVLFIVIWNG